MSIEQMTWERMDRHYSARARVEIEQLLASGSAEDRIRDLEQGVSESRGDHDIQVIIALALLEIARQLAELNEKRKNEQA